MKIALIDLETTGLCPSKHEIIEIGLIVFDSKNYQILEEWSTKVKPFYPENGDPKAYDCNGYTDQEWKDAPQILPILEKLSEKVQGCILMAYNISFDSAFLEYNFEKYGIKNPFSYQKMCLMSLAFGKVPHDKVYSWSLRTICTYLGITPEPKTHRGANGAKKAYEVYVKLMS